MTTDCDYLILGAGIYGSYIARRLGERGASVVLADCDPEPFTRASYINQARVHNGYHYPRSLSTAAHSARYFERFNEEFSFAINNSFKKIYAISRAYSMTSAEQFEAFCRYAGIPCEQISAGRVFAPGTVDAAFETLEYSFDAHRIRDFLMGSINDMKNVSVRMNARFDRAERDGDRWRVGFPDGSAVRARHVINATYAATNQVLAAFGFEGFRLKYEIAEVTLCRVAGPIEGLGVTVMDGPFFSLMPFGLGGEYSLTSVIDTPRRTSYEELPTFDCQ